ncbi:MAG: hypothetical protein C0467_12730 [Planctomycetaceae bacterium]|nr:hypothetical protein [Planctomycetaceae bacterium]
MKRSIIASSALATAFAVAFAIGGQAQLPPKVATPLPATVAAAAPNEADREAIVKASREFAEAFNKGDAKAVAGMWTENGESREATGETFVGRAAIEKAYAAYFKANPDAKIELLVKAVRFPAKDMAIEEGLIRQSRGPKDLPRTTSYVAVHSREGGQWKVALSSEAGVGQDRLEDLEWLHGEWTTKVKDDTVKFSVVRDPKKPTITATFTRTPPGKDPITGSIRISLDPETGRIRSWGFEDDGAHWQGLWFCDGKSWVIDARGVLANGTPTAERIVLQRVGPDVITWRAIDRVVGDTHLADTAPMRLTRAAAK